ncbi:MAG: M48 family metalloprotease [Myxococcota bacterium]|nr:M48 family metalloprotease [Myxococcota bacterium]
MGSKPSPKANATRRAAPVLVALILACSVQILAACARNPVSGRPEAVLTSERGEIQQGNEAARVVEEQIGLVDDPELRNYLDQLGQSLAAHSPRSQIVYRFEVADMPEANAFALPGGHIYVSRGLLTLVNSEDQLAAVLGHEIAHVAARHSVRKQAVSVPLAPLRIAAALGGAAAAIVSPGLGQVVAGLGELPAQFALAAYSRDQEREADRIGQEIAARAGFDPLALSTFNDILIREAALKKGDAQRSPFLLSHPPGPERSEAAREHAKQLTIATRPTAPPDRKTFLEHFTGLVIGEPAAGGVFKDDRFLHPQLGIGFALPSGWESFNNPRSVLARSPNGSAEIVVEIVDQDESALAAAEALGKLIRFDGSPRSIEIGGLEAAEASAKIYGRNSVRQLLLTFVAYDGLVYRIAGTVPMPELAEVYPYFTQTSFSFHVLSEEEREEILENRLEIVRAEVGEGLEELGKKNKNQWSLAETALANGVDEGAPLAPGWWVKIARRRPYSGPVNAERSRPQEPQDR